jgi:putative molybdopterin biosynthesis protein
MKQDQFLNVIDRDEAERRFHAALDLRPLEEEEIALREGLGRVLSRDVTAPVDVPGFDRSNVDGFAVQAADTFGASEDRPQTLTLTGEVLAPGFVPRVPLLAGFASVIATGSMMPRGADAVVMVEHTDAQGNAVAIRKPVTPGANVSFAGTDIGRGETLLRRGDLLTSRDTGVLAALGLAHLCVVRRPRVAIVSTGNELVAPGQNMRPGLVYDSNATILADAVRELGGEPVHLGIVPDDRLALAGKLQDALACDVVLLSGGTSKGEGDLSYRVVADLGRPGIIVHGVALKPGKPLCLAAVEVAAPPSGGKTTLKDAPAFVGTAEDKGNAHAAARRTVPVVILPGFPTSAIFTFHEFVAPVVRLFAGRPHAPKAVVTARLPLRVNSERGRTEYLLTGLVQDGEGSVAYPMGKGSGSVTAFSRADGFVVIPRQQEYLEAGAFVEVQLLAPHLRAVDLVVIGSHCVGLDYLLGKVQERGFRTKFLAVGSTGGLEAARRGECDLAGVHLLDPATNVYNRPFLSPDLELVAGYHRLQGLVFRWGDSRFAGKTLAEAVASALADPSCVLVNRNRGSGTRILIDRLLQGAQPPGFSVEAKSHNGVVAAIAQSRADWGVAIETVARDAGLGFAPIQEECYDFVLPKSRGTRPAFLAFLEILRHDDVRACLANMGFR